MAFSRIQSVVNVFIVLSQVKSTVQQFDNLIHLVLPVHYASSCHVAFSRIQSVVNVFIVLSQVKSTVQQFDNLIHLVLPVHYDFLCHAAFNRIQSDDNVFIVLSQLFICLKPIVQCIFNSLTIVLEFVLNCINPKYSDTKTQGYLTI